MSKRARRKRRAARLRAKQASITRALPSGRIPRAAATSSRSTPAQVTKPASDQPRTTPPKAAKPVSDQPRTTPPKATKPALTEAAKSKRIANVAQEYAAEFGDKFAMTAMMAGLRPPRARVAYRKHIKAAIQQRDAEIADLRARILRLDPLATFAPAPPPASLGTAAPAVASAPVSPATPSPVAPTAVSPVTTAPTVPATADTPAHQPAAHDTGRPPILYQL